MATNLRLRKGLVIRRAIFGLSVGGLLLFLGITVGMMMGFHMSLTPANAQTAYQQYILKGTYLFDRYSSVSTLPEEFGKRWLPQIREFSRHSKIGVYVGEGSNATPFFPLQLEKLGFDVVRFGRGEHDKISKCDLIIFPGGHYSLSDWPSESTRALTEYVRNGGGFIGICLGLLAAKNLGLIDGDLEAFPVTGLLECRTVDRSFLRRSPSHSVVTFLHMNGRLLTRQTSLKPLVMCEQDVLAGYRDFGRGRMVLFSSHPEGGKIEYGNDYMIVEGTSLGTMDLLLDAIFYVSRR